MTSRDQANHSQKAVPAISGKEVGTAGQDAPWSHRLAELVGLFLRLGFTAFGGPAAHIAMMREEVVRKRQWVSAERFVDLIGVTNLIPGPSSTELAIYLGYLRAGWLGLLVAGICFIGPAMLIVLALALMTGVLFQLGQHALIDVVTWAIALIALLILLRFKINSFWLILAGAAIGLLRFWVPGG